MSRDNFWSAKTGLFRLKTQVHSFCRIPGIDIFLFCRTGGRTGERTGGRTENMLTSTSSKFIISATLVFLLSAGVLGGFGCSMTTASVARSLHDTFGLRNTSDPNLTSPVHLPAMSPTRHLTAFRPMSVDVRKWWHRTKLNSISRGHTVWKRLTKSNWLSKTHWNTWDQSNNYQETWEPTFSQTFIYMSLISDRLPGLSAKQDCEARKDMSTTRKTKGKLLCKHVYRNVWYRNRQRPIIKPVLNNRLPP